jgi:hypothetical protein
MATARTRYVNPDSSGGNGTTSATSGANAAYASLQAALDAEAGDLVSANEYLEVICATNGTADGAVYIDSADGWVCDATRNIRIRAANGHRAGTKWNASKYRIASTGVSNAFLSEVPFVEVSGLQMTNLDDEDARQGLVLIASGGGFKIDGCYVRRTSNSIWTNHAIRIGGDTTNESYIWNCIAEGWSSGNSAGFTQSGANVTVYNCTAIDCAYGFTNSDNGYNLKVYNCLASGCGNGFDAGWSWGPSDYNASDLASDAPGSNSRNSQTFTFVAADDFALTGSDTGARNYGVTDPGAGLFSTDIHGNTRTAPWDIGAFEFVANDAPRPISYYYRTLGAT